MLRANLDTSQTIFALSSGAPPTAIAVIRLSGPQSFILAERFFRVGDSLGLPRQRGMVLGHIIDPVSQLPIDQALALTFVAPHSFTGEDTLELQCHGSVAVVGACERMLVGLGARPAMPGEFSYRAMLNGKMSPRQVDELGDVFRARTRGDLERIFARRDQALERKVAQLREHLIGLQAIFDTAVDFTEEYSHVVAAAHRPLHLAIHECSEITLAYQRFLGSGSTAPRLVLAGRTNAGKSSLFNALLGRYRAIVSDTAGTTRDVIEEDVELGGQKWKLVDTAGVRGGARELERQGISLGADYLSAASLWILVVDGTVGIREDERALLEKFGNLPHLVVWNKSDLPEWQAPPSDLSGELSFPLSVRLGGESLTRLGDQLDALAKQGEAPSVPLPSATQAGRLRQVSDSLLELRASLDKGVPAEYLSEQNRTVLNRLSSVLGEVGPEDVLDRIFSEFCIGK
jgi:tRNA modification GTPase